MTIKIINKLDTGYLLLQTPHPGIFFGNAVVQNNNGESQVVIVNTTDQESAIIQPQVEITEIEIREKTEKLLTNIQDNERIIKIKQFVHF